MIIGCIIAQQSSGVVHCEYYESDQTRYEQIRQQIKKFLRSLNTVDLKGEVFRVVDNSNLHFLAKNGVAFILVYKSDFPKQLGKSCLLEIQQEFEQFLRQQMGISAEIYSHLETVTKSYSQLKFGWLKRSSDSEGFCQTRGYSL